MDYSSEKMDGCNWNCKLKSITQKICNWLTYLFILLKVSFIFVLSLKRWEAEWIVGDRLEVNLHWQSLAQCKAQRITFLISQLASTWSLTKMTWKMSLSQEEFLVKDMKIVRVKVIKEARKGFSLLYCLWNEGRLQRRMFNGVS